MTRGRPRALRTTPYGTARVESIGRALSADELAAVFDLPPLEFDARMVAAEIRQGSADSEGGLCWGGHPIPAVSNRRCTMWLPATPG